MLDRGERVEFATQQSFIISGDGPFMPVQYLEGQNGGAGTGDPASYQMVPTEQFLPRYVFVTGSGYNLNYVQITRPLGGADVLVDGVPVTGYYTVGQFEVADWSIQSGPAGLNPNRGASSPPSRPMIGELRPRCTAFTRTDESIRQHSRVLARPCPSLRICAASWLERLGFAIGVCQGSPLRFRLARISSPDILLQCVRHGRDSVVCSS